MLFATPSEYIQYLLDSIAYGSLFSLMALGLALLFGVMGLMNFAYGELIMAGAYTMFFTQSWGWLAMILMTILVVVDPVAAHGAGRVPPRPQCLGGDPADHVLRGQLRAPGAGLDRRARDQSRPRSGPGCRRASRRIRGSTTSTTSAAS